MSEEIKYGWTTKKLEVRSVGGFLLASYPEGTPCKITAGTTFGLNETISLHPVDVIGRQAGSHSWYIKTPEGTVNEGLYIERKPTALELAYAAARETVDRLEVYADAERR